MTTNANKHGLRAAAKERSNRHAQRTPLPPRAGAVQDALDVIAYAKSAELAEAHASAKPGKANGAAVVAVEVRDSKSLGKAQTFSALAATAGWEATTEVRGDATEVTATRGAETIVQAWLSGVWQYDASVYAYGDRSTKPRNASGARKLLDRTEADASAEMAKVLSNNSFRKREPIDLATAKPRLPFDPELATNEEVLAVLAGQAVVWYNRISRGKESALMGRERNRITVLEDGARVVNTCCPVTGFRSFLVTAILQVGRGRKIETVDTATVTLEEVTV
jgi:hypothetical protein